MIFRRVVVAGEENGERRVLGQSVYASPRTEIGASDTDDNETVVFILNALGGIGDTVQISLRDVRQIEPAEHL